MSFLKHVGKHGDRKIAVLFREVPNEPHMCLVTYTETLNRHVHDPMMACIESNIGQQSENLADALNRQHTHDGKYILQVLHSDRLIKKVKTAEVVMTPNPTTTIRLDELNKILNEMKQGEEAVKKLAEFDNSLGMQTPADVARRMRDNKPVHQEPPRNIQAGKDTLGDTQLANSLLSQAQRMASEARGLLAESARLEQQANDMLGIPTTTQPMQPTMSAEPVKRGRGRPAKAKSVA
jgi:predicted transcriptional regulator